ncbi:hypothetical protein XCR_3527 [Xanthomonas campestris pv. raphani 756C]|nr:hypothetical protein XCR_3527 [Xanthomonas campestris pv. raphani 756C]
MLRDLWQGSHHGVQRAWPHAVSHVDAACAARNSKGLAGH